MKRFEFVNKDGVMVECVGPSAPIRKYKYCDKCEQIHGTEALHGPVSGTYAESREMRSTACELCLYRFVCPLWSPMK